MNNHEELYPEDKQKYIPEDVPHKVVKNKEGKLIWFVAGIMFGSLSLLMIIHFELDTTYVSSEKLNASHQLELNTSYQIGLQDAFKGIMEYTKRTGITYVEHEGSLVELRCYIPQNLNETGGK